MRAGAKLRINVTPRVETSCRQSGPDHNPGLAQKVIVGVARKRAMILWRLCSAVSVLGANGAHRKWNKI